MFLSEWKSVQWITYETNNNNQFFNAKSRQIIFNRQIKTWEIERSIGHLWVWFSSIVFTIELSPFIKFDWTRLMSITERSFRYIRFSSSLVSKLLLRTGVALHYEINPISLSHFRLCSHYLSQVGSMYSGEEYYFDSTLVWNCMGISFNRSGLSRLVFDMKLVRVKVTKRITVKFRK